MSMCSKNKNNNMTLENELQMIRTELSRLKSLVLQETYELKIIENHIQEWQDSKETIGETISERVNERKRIQNIIKLKKKEQKDLEKEDNVDTQKIDDARKLRRDLRSKLYDKELDLKEAKALINVLQYKIAVLQGDEDMIIHDDVMQILDLEIKDCNEFKETPVGPILKYIVVKERAWSSPIKFFLSSLLYSYCVDNADDGFLLSAIFKRVLVGTPKPSIITSTFTNKVHDVSPYFVTPVAAGTFNFMEMIEVSQPVVMNALIDHLEVEQVLLIPTNQEARQLLDGQTPLPQNLQKVLTKEGGEFKTQSEFYSKSHIYEEICDKIDRLEAEEAIERDAPQQIETLKREVNESEIQLQELIDVRAAKMMRQSNIKCDLYELEFDLLCLQPDELETYWKSFTKETRAMKTKKTATKRKILQSETKIAKLHAKRALLHAARINAVF